nr:uncharacterized protein LOC123279712 [Equus asinus]
MTDEASKIPRLPPLASSNTHNSESLQISFLSPVCLFPYLKENKKDRERERERERKKKEKRKKRKKKKGEKKKKKKNLAQLSCCCLPPRVTWCSGLVLSFHSLPLLPAGGWNRGSLSREQRTQSRRLQYFLQEKKKRLLQPLLQAKFRFPLLAISNSKAIFAAKLLPLELNPGNSDAGGELFLILPSIYPTQELPSFLFLPSFKIFWVLSSVPDLLNINRDAVIENKCFRMDLCFFCSVKGSCAGRSLVSLLSCPFLAILPPPLER